MATVTLTTEDFAGMLRTCDCVLIPYPIAGHMYAVIRGTQDSNIYRTAIP